MFTDSSGAFAFPFMNSESLIRPLVRTLHAYVPGEQPKIKGLIKLNTNENPYPPLSRVWSITSRLERVCK
jgi:hypothetical protein